MGYNQFDDDDEDLLTMMQREIYSAVPQPPEASSDYLSAVPQPPKASPDFFPTVPQPPKASPDFFPAVPPEPEAPYPSAKDSLLELEQMIRQPEAGIAYSGQPANPWGGVNNYSVEAAASRVWLEESNIPNDDFYDTSHRTQQSGLKEMKKMRKQELRRHPIRRAFVIIIALALAVVALGYFGAYGLAGKANRRALKPAESASLAAASGSKDVTNILLIGLDNESDADSRSDTMLLLSIDRHNRKLKLTSFLRDSWLPLPNGQGSKLNAAYRQGGPATLMQTISGNFNVRIDHYALVKFEGFEALIDALGGISIPVTEAEANWLCSETRLGKQIGLESMRQQMSGKGGVKMTGEQALIYCRIRKLDDDFNRTQRQRKVLGIIAARCKNNPLALPLAAGKFLPHLQTDMSQAELANLAAAAPAYLTYGIEEHQIPAQGTWRYDKRNNASVIILDVANNAQRLRAFIYG